MKKCFLSVLLFFFSAVCIAQLIKKPAAPVNFSDSLSKIVIDFKNNFTRLQGNSLPAQPDAEVYRSRICLPGGLHCVIYRYHSLEDKSGNWKALMYSGESFEDALKAYKNTFNSVKKSRISGITVKPASFEGSMETPDENLRFSVSSLRLKTEDIKYKNLVAEVELTNSYAGWEVNLNIYSKKTIKEEKEEEE